MTSYIKNGIGLISVNSSEYVKELFRIYDSNRTAVLLKSNILTTEINGITLDEIIEPKVNSGWFTPSYSSILSEKIAHVAFTSGTEGAPKAIAISHLALEDTAKRLIDVMGLDESIKEYVGAPVNFSFGLGRCRAIAKVGGRAYLPPHGFDPIEISKLLHGGEINAISAVPTLWRILLQHSKYFDEIGSKLRWIEIGSQYMSKSEKIALAKLFPKAKIIQHYGLTEASRTTFLDITNENEALESVGKATGDVEIKINQENKICIKGSHLCSGVVIEGVINSLCDDDGWFETNDFGTIENNYLYYKGRSDDIINCGGIKVSPDILEREIRQSIGDIKIGFCISKVTDLERGELPMLALLKESSSQKDFIEKLLIQELKLLGLNLQKIPTMIVDKMPTTATDKIQRKVLTSQYEPPTLTQKNISQYTHSVGDIYENIFLTPFLEKHSSFDSLGGDSLNYVKATIAIEEYFGYLPDDWNKLSIQELEKKHIKKAKSLTVDTDILLRTVAIMAVVMGHSGMSLVGGGTQLLIVLVGFNLAKFQSDNLLSGRVWSSIYKYSIKLIIPYLILVITYFIWKNAFSWDRIFFYTNYVPFELRTPSIFPEWFIQVLLQSLIIIGILLSFEKVRNIINKNIWFNSYLILIFLIILRFVYPYIHDTEHLFNRIPPIYLASLWLGWAVFFSKTTLQKFIVFILALILSFIHLGFSLSSLWLSVGAFLLLFTRNFKLPLLLKRTCLKIASATFYIYLFHMIFIHIPNNFLKLDNVYINIMCGIAGGVLVFNLSEMVKRLVFSKKLQRRLVN